MQSRENKHSLITGFLGKIKGHNVSYDSKNPVRFEDVVYYFKNARNIGFAADAYIQYVEIEGFPAALKIIKLSHAESEVANFRNTSDINKLGVKSIRQPHPAGFNIWREIDAMERLSPNMSNFQGFPYMYGFFMTRWADLMIKDMSMYDREKDGKYKKFLKDREDNDVCILILMEHFDYDLLRWTDRRHSIDEWKDVYRQIFQCISDIHKLNIVHNDTHEKNFLIKKQEGGWLVSLCDFGSNISTNYDLHADEKRVYEESLNSNRDPVLFLQRFDQFNIAVYQFGRLKRNKVMSDFKQHYPVLVGEIKNRIKKPLEHSLFWLAVVEVMASNIEYFSDLIDMEKLPPPELLKLLDGEYEKMIKSSHIYDLDRTIISLN